MEEFVWNLISTGTTDIVKGVIGKSFEKLKAYSTDNNREQFNQVLNIILDSNDEIKKKLESLKNGDSIIQNHSGTGDNVVGGKTINNISYSIDKEGLDNKFELSNEAQELLEEAIHGSKRTIILTNTLSEGIHVQTNGKCFTENVDIRTANKYRNALDELIEIRFVKPRGKFYSDVTEDGYKYIDNISN